MRHLLLRECGYAIGFIVLMAVLYPGAYFLMVQRRAESWIDAEKGWCSGVIPKYRFAHGISALIFRPIHEFDKSIRPEYWRYGVADWLEIARQRQHEVPHSMLLR